MWGKRRFSVFSFFKLLPKRKTNQMNNKQSLSTFDLGNARKNAKFSPTSIHKLLMEGSRSSEIRKKISIIIENDPILTKAKRPYMSRAERLAGGLLVVSRLNELNEVHKWTYAEVSRNRISRNDLNWLN